MKRWLLLAGLLGVGLVALLAWSLSPRQQFLGQSKQAFQSLTKISSRDISTYKEKNARWVEVGAFSVSPFPTLFTDSDLQTGYRDASHTIKIASFSQRLGSYSSDASLVRWSFRANGAQKTLDVSFRHLGKRWVLTSASFRDLIESLFDRTYLAKLTLVADLNAAPGNTLSTADFDLSYLSSQDRFFVRIQRLPEAGAKEAFSAWLAARGLKQSDIRIDFLIPHGV